MSMNAFLRRRARIANSEYQVANTSICNRGLRPYSEKIYCVPYIFLASFNFYIGQYTYRETLPVYISSSSSERSSQLFSTSISESPSPSS